MSSAEEECPDPESSSNVHSSKKRKIQRACDICRRKKVRCDGGQMPGNRCSNCISYNLDCTYVEAAKKRGPPKGYVESLENRLEKMEKLLQTLCPDGDFSKELGGSFDKESWYKGRSNANKLKTLGNSSTATSQHTPLATSSFDEAPSPADDGLHSSDDEYATISVTDELRQLSVERGNTRFFGKSSGVVLIQTAMDMKKEFTATNRGDDNPDSPVPGLLNARRPEFWHFEPWIIPKFEDPEPNYQFPPSDLLVSLVDLYFINMNSFLPLLHRPTFEKSLREGLHYRDDGFGAVVLLVSSVGCRFSDDPRVILEGTNSTHSAGWAWFHQVQMIRRSLFSPPSLYDLQVYCLSAIFLQGSSAPQSCWTLIGIGIRLVQDVGAHRRKVYGTNLTAEDELWKRAFWVLVVLDRMTSSALGRPCALQDEDFDLDLPIECDDEYWTHSDPKQAFKQPMGKPTYMSYFICFLKLNRILAFALRTIYSINKSKALLGFVGQQWEQHIVAELDSALNKWVDSVPDYLRWDPHREDLLLFRQSAILYTNYYHLQILVHRPFIPSPRKPSPLSFPSLAICTNAARSCSHLIDFSRPRLGPVLHQCIMSIFTSGIVLLLNIWGGKRSGISLDPVKEMEDVHRCMEALRYTEKRWHSAGRLWDILYELASVGDLPLPQPSPTSSNKRERDSDSPSSTTAETPPASSKMEIRIIASSRRVSKEAKKALSQPRPEIAALASADYQLPIHSHELGRIPLHPDLDPQNAPSSGDADMAVSNHHSWYQQPQTASSSVPTLSLPSSSTSMNPPGGDQSMAALFSIDPSLYDEMMSSFGGETFPQAMVPNLQGYGAPPTQPIPQVDALPMSFGQGYEALSNSDTLDMWSNAPTGFEWDDWGTYAHNFSGINKE